MGSYLWDVVGRLDGEASFGEDRGGNILRRPGGVGYNIAKRLADLGYSPIILGCVGTDHDGTELVTHCKTVGMRTEHMLQRADIKTDAYMVIEDDQGAVLAVADARSLEHFGEDVLLPLQDGRLGSDERPSDAMMIVDGNFTTQQLGFIANSPAFSKAHLHLSPASTGKVERLRPLLTHPNVTLYCNLTEANSLAQTHYKEAADAAKALLDLGLKRALVTHGAQRACDAEQGCDTVSETPKQVDAHLITGAGDVFMATHIHLTLEGHDKHFALRESLDAAADHIARKD